MKKNIYIPISTILISLFLFLGSTVFILQTNYFKEKIKSSISKYIKEKNIPIEIGSLEISFPLKCTFTNLKIENTLQIEKGEFTINIFALLLKKLSLPYLNIEEVKIEKREKDKKDKKPFIFPLSISINSLNIKNIYFNSQILSITGKLKFKKDLNNIFLDIKISEKKFKTSYVNIFLNGIKKKDILSIIKINFDDLKGNETYLELKSTPSFTQFKNFIFSEEENTIIIDGKGSFSSKQLKDYFQKNFKIYFSLQLSNKLNFNFSDLLIKNNFINIFGKVNLRDSKINSLNLDIKSKNINIFNPIVKIPLNGIFKAKLKKIDENIILSSKIKNFKIKDVEIKNNKIRISIKDSFKEKILSGNILTTAFILEEKLEIKSNFSWNILRSLLLKNISINSPSFESSGNIKINKFLEGSFKSKFKNLKFFKNIILSNLIEEKFSSLEGMLESSITFSKENDNQNILINILLKDYFSNYLEGDFFKTEITINNFFQDPKFYFTANIKNSKSNVLKIKNLFFKTEITNKFKNPYELLLDSPINLKSYGSWNYLQKKLQVILTETELLINNKKAVDKNTELLLSKNLFNLKNLNLEGDNFYLKTDIDITKEKNDISITTKNLPLDLINLTPKNLLSGKISSKIFLKDNKGKIDISLTDSKIDGQINASLEKKELSLKGNFFQNQKEFLNLKGDLPIHLEFFPFQLKIIKNKPLNISGYLEEKFENLTTFIELKNHDLKGDIKSNFSISNTLEHLKVNGLLTFKNGIYQNYLHGIFLNNITANFIFKKDKIILSSLSGEGTNKGTMTATGDINIKKNIPFLFNIHLNDLGILQNEIINAKATGTLQVQGDKNQALTSGNITINRADITIPEKLPNKMPEIKINFINKPKEKIITDKKLYILNLNLNLSTSDLIFIKGRGINAQLKGKGKITGSSQKHIIDGKLELIKGDFLFSGRSFKLKEGILIFEEKPDAIPYLSIKAETVQKGVVLIAYLKGNINDLTLSFSSSPPLPLSSIISLIMFGEELSSISATQTLQITSTLDSLYKESEVEGKQKTLGIDRIAIVSPSTNDLEDPDKTSIQIGKYVTKGVLVSYSQGTEEGTSNASVSIDLGLGFTLELETIQEEEQNKATIKWSKNF